MRGHHAVRVQAKATEMLGVKVSRLCAGCGIRRTCRRAGAQIHSATYFINGIRAVGADNTIPVLFRAGPEARRVRGGFQGSRIQGSRVPGFQGSKGSEVLRF